MAEIRYLIHIYNVLLYNSLTQHIALLVGIHTLLPYIY